METVLIQDEDKFIEVHAYGKNDALKNLPTSYPCILLKKFAGGGVGGEYIQHDLYYFPEGIENPDDYFKGFCAALPIEE